MMDTLLLSDSVLKMERGDKVKVKFTLEQTTKAQRRSRGIALLFP